MEIDKEAALTGEEADHQEGAEVDHSHKGTEAHLGMIEDLLVEM